MQLFHTSDWHLGRLLHGASLLEDQAHALDQLCELACQHRPDVILIAGDVYDRPVPPATAITLLDRTLSKLIHELNTPVLLISGNHDSAERLGFASSALSRSGLHVISSLEQILDPISIHTDQTETLIWAIPYIDPETVRLFFKQNAHLENSANPDSSSTLASTQTRSETSTEARPTQGSATEDALKTSANQEAVNQAAVSHVSAEDPSSTSTQTELLSPVTATALERANQLERTSKPANLIHQLSERRLKIARHAQKLNIDPAMIRDHQGAYEAIMAVINAERAERKADAHVLVGHCFAGGALESDSERPLSIGGSDQVEARVFAGFDYVALGHLHRPQQIKSERVRYSGSLMKYSFSEATHTKAVLKVELSPSQGSAQADSQTAPQDTAQNSSDGSPSGTAKSSASESFESACNTDLSSGLIVTPLSLTPLRDMQRISGKFADILLKAKATPSQNYVQIELTDSGAIFDPMAQLKDYYPNLLNLTRKRSQSIGDERGNQHAKSALLSETELFEQFAKQVLGEELSVDETRVASDLIEQALKKVSAI